mgnify:CR=1 FL=1
MGLNDPQWGSKNSGGPPDLDELMRNLNKKISGLFGGKGGSGNKSGGTGEPPQSFGIGIGLVVVIVALLWVASGFYIVDASSRGVVNGVPTTYRSSIRCTSGSAPATCSSR